LRRVPFATLHLESTNFYAAVQPDSVLVKAKLLQEVEKEPRPHLQVTQRDKYSSYSMGTEALLGSAGDKRERVVSSNSISQKTTIEGLN
jgi:hypothetical protein